MKTTKESARFGAGDDVGVWLDVVSAVQFLARTSRPGLSVADAVAEASADWTEGMAAARWGDLSIPSDNARGFENDPDPLRAAIERHAVGSSPAGSPGVPVMGVVLTASLRAWSQRMAEDFNESAPWPHPVPPGGWPL